MSETIKKRLGKAAQEFNVGTDTIVELLKKKGFTVEHNANAKLEEQMYEILVKEYSGEKIVKENAQKKIIEIPKSIEIPVIEKKYVPEEIEDRAVLIKGNTIDIEKPKFEAPKVLGKIDLDAYKSKPTPKPHIDEISTTKTEPKPEIIEKNIDEVPSDKGKSKISSDDQLPKGNEIVKQEQSSENSSAKPNLKQVGFIDLSTINEKTKPAKKNKEQLRKEIENRKATTEKMVQAEQEKNVIENTPIIENNTEKAVSEDTPSKDIFMKTDVKKLEGPKIMGKMDLETVKKPTAKTPENQAARNEENRRKKKRKRINPANPLNNNSGTSNNNQGQPNQQGGGQNNTSQAGQNTQNRPNQGGQRTGYQGNNPNTGAPRTGYQGNNPNTGGGAPRNGYQGNNPNTGGGAPRTGYQGGQNRPNQGGGAARPGYQGQGGQNRPGQGGGANKFNKTAPNKDFKKPEISDEEIDRQIKETLARLGPSGKSKTSKHRRDKRSNVNQKYLEQMDQAEQEKKFIKVAEFLTANELASLMEIPVTNIISTCMSIGLFVSINQRLDAETISLLADEFGYGVNFVSADSDDDSADEIDSVEDLTDRSPIVTVMGHVDHGKTSLLDYIRKTNVIAGEAGGITQHVGAYEVTLDNGKKITFLDTPGHEAFTAMRARGAKVTDIAIIVIAADDLIMPQTIEAINHAQAANVPMVFAINKIDKANAVPEKIREGLANMNILVEEWGGKFQCQEISAKKGLNIDSLLEKVLIEAEMLELKANKNRLANGTVIESSLDKGRGYVAKILVQNGTLNIGDFVVAGTTYGKVKAMYNERNVAIDVAGPSVPLLLLGLNTAPQAGDTFKVYKEEHEAKTIATKRSQLQREQGIRTQKHITLDEIGRRIAIGDFKELNIIVKGDVNGSIEALSDSLLKLTSDQVQVNVIHKSVGLVTESDVLLASASNAIIVAFQVRPSPQARKLAEVEEIDIRMYSIIYNAINEIKDAIEGMLSPEIQEKIICNLEIREVFDINKVGNIAGCIVLDGKINRNTKVRIIRNGIVVYTGKLGSLKRFKDDAKEVFAGQDCGLNIENFNDIKVGDIVEGYDEIEVKRTLK